MSSSVKLHLLGQSIWYDNLKRSLIRDGTLKGMIERREIYGVTSNPSIFQNAIANSHDYDADLQTMSWSGLDANEIFYRLAIQDIQELADQFLPYYEASNGEDGFVSLEVNPNLAHDTKKTIEEAKLLWKQVNRPNLMVKIPATQAGLPAITEAIAAGVNVNVTLIFSRERYMEVMSAYLDGIEKRLAGGEAVEKIASVASFFVSRFESNADAKLQKLVDEGGESADKAKSLVGKLAVANTRLAYRDYENFFDSERFDKLEIKGANKQRPLWASTSTKDPDYDDIKYVQSLIAENTVNTVPPETLEAFLDHGDPEITIYNQLDQAEQYFRDLADLGISLDKITQELEDEGVRKFAESFDSLIETIEKRRKAFLSDLGPLVDAVQDKTKEFKDKDTVGRIFRNDPLLWVNKPDEKNEVQKRLGWLNLPVESESIIPALVSLVDKCKQDGIEKVLILGMGGSSLAPETMSLVLGQNDSGFSLKVMDSTNPQQIQTIESWLDYEKTLFIVSSKSGTTIETRCLFDYFWAQSDEVLGSRKADHFIAITDPGSELADIGRNLKFRQVFTANPNVGGRFSALSHFGLVPAALMGINLDDFLAHARRAATDSSPATPIELNLGVLLGIILGVCAEHDRNKLTILADDENAPFGSWLEQLVAESSGKQGKGIVPVVGEPVYQAEAYSKDRMFVYLRQNGQYDGLTEELKKIEHPVIVMEQGGINDLAASFYRWEMAVSIACSILGVNAFDQPDVQESKNRTKKQLITFLEDNRFEESDWIWERDGIRISSTAPDILDSTDALEEVIESFVSAAQPGAYIAINAYLEQNAKTLDMLTKFRSKLHDKTGLPTTLGYGPRFLHSSGQLHKGGPENGLFIQITQPIEKDMDIPGRDYSFSILMNAQALGDKEALLAKNRSVLHIDLEDLEKLKV